MKTFTDTQKLACDLSRNIAITAGAGSGKTSVLVERYVWCLRNNGYQIPRIVAITFTEKAAGEMLGRIRARILDYASTSLGDAGRWETVLERLPLANIATIHGFCQRLLREFPIEAGVDPGFEVLDESVRLVLLHRLIDAVIQEHSAACDRHLATLAEIWSPYVIKQVLLELLARREASLPWARSIRRESCAEYVQRVTKFADALMQQGVARLLHNADWQGAIREIRTIMPVGDSSKLTARCRNILEYDAEFRAQTLLSDRLLTLAMLEKDCRMVTPSAAWKAEGRNARLKAAFQQIKALYDECLPTLTVNDAVERSGFAIQQALAELLQRVQARYEQEKAARRTLDFDDLQEKALHLLQQSDIQTVLRQRYDYVMVDEFQDTNHLQWDVIHRLGATAQGLGPHTFCIVGDEKQSIYMFRGADVAVFHEVRQQLQRANVATGAVDAPHCLPELGEPPAIRAEHKSGELVMAENFRSEPAVLFFLNYLFARIFLPAWDAERPFHVPHQALRPGRKETDSERTHPPTPSLEKRGGEERAYRSGFLAEVPGNTRCLEDSTTGVAAEEHPGCRALTTPGVLFSGGEERDVAEISSSPSLPKRGGRGVSSADVDIPAPIELLLIEPTDEAETSAVKHLTEPELVALRIKELTASFRYLDIAILLRTRTRLKEFEEALRRHEIPFVVAGGIGFFQQQELYDLTNLLRALVDPRQDIALAGALRSPLFGFSDDQLLFARTPPDGQPTHPLADALLWQQLAYHAEHQAGIPAELAPEHFVYAHQRLNSWQTLANRIPITHLLRRILDDTGLPGMLAGDRRETQTLTNIDKLLELARNFEHTGFQTLHDFVDMLDHLIELEERESEAQLNIEGMDVVRLMTIHAAKGLEFPVVFVPELERPFNYGVGASVYVDMVDCGAGKQPVVGVKGLRPDDAGAAEDTVFRTYLQRLTREKTDAEMQRLLYVACTRAERHLILSGDLSETPPSSSWLTWLLNVLPIQESVAQGAFTITDVEQTFYEPQALTIPIRASGAYAAAARSQARPAPALTPLFKAMLHQASAFAPRPDSSDTSVPSDFDEQFRAVLHRNLRPLRGPENTYLRISPSTIHTLFESPRQYYEQHILQLPAALSELSEDDAESPEVPDFSGSARPGGKERGTLLHKLFEAQVFDGEQSEQAMLAAANAALDRMRVPADIRRAMGLEALILQAARHYRQAGLRDLIASAPQVFREYAFTLRIGQLEIVGTLDVLFRDHERQQWTILDYKSNEIAADAVAAEMLKHRYDVQMQLYALAVARIFKAANLRSLVFFTVPGVVYDAVDVSPAACAHVLDDITQRLAVMTT